MGNLSGNNRQAGVCNAPALDHSIISRHGLKPAGLRIESPWAVLEEMVQ